MQEAFIEAGAFQCGYCTPGFILMATQLLDEHPDPDDDQIKHYLSGNLCRCATYPEIIEAVKLAAQEAQGRRTGLRCNERKHRLMSDTVADASQPWYRIAQSPPSGRR